MPKNDDDALKDAREAYEQCKSAETHNRATALEDIQFARKGDQWPADIMAQRVREGRPCLTINKLPAFIRQVVNDSRQNKPSIKVHPADSNADPATAEVINGLIRNIEYTSNADVAYDTAVESAVSCGFGYWRVVADYACDDSFDMDLKIKRVNNPFSIFGDPNSAEADSSDWDVAFVVDRLSKQQFKAQYGNKSQVNWDDESWTGMLGTDWRDETSVLVAEHWTREKVQREIVITNDGKVFAKEDLESDPDLQMLMQMGVIQIANSRMADSYKVRQRIMSGVEILEDNDWAGKYIPIIPVYGDEFDIEGKRYFRSLIHPALDSQRMFNYWRTNATELVALAPKVPFIGPKGAFDSDQERWNTANTRSHAYLEYDGPQPPQRQPLDMGAAAGSLQEALNASDDIKAILGMYDASLGARSNETSGRAIMARQHEGDVSTFHFTDNVERAIRHTGRILIDLIPHHYNSKRVVRVMGEDGAPTNVPINQPFNAQTGQPVPGGVPGQPAPQSQPPTPEGVPAANGAPQQPPQPAPGETPIPAIIAIHDLTVGKYDLTVESGPSFTTRREETVQAMTELVRAFPQAAPVVAPELVRSMDWPNADKIAKGLESMASQQIPPQLQQQIQEGQQQIQQLTQENQQLKLDQSVEMAKAQAQAETARQKAAADMDVQNNKAQAEIQIAQTKAAAEIQLQREKAHADMQLRHAQALGDQQLATQRLDNEKQIGQAKVDNEAGLAAQKGQKPTAVMDHIGELKKVIAAHGDNIKELHKAVTAPTELIRDPKTGRAIGARKKL